ncbi:MAG: hypothetical protein OXI33_00810 [Chloroflexota bacterium]|nr:hypothetical protein [Chloroflexota bacterium]
MLRSRYRILQANLRRDRGTLKSATLAFLKSVFADRRMAEIRMSRHVPDWEIRIDFSTLPEESTGRVSQ